MSENYPKANILEYIRELERRVEDLERTPRLPSSSISYGSLVVSGGDIIVYDSNGDEVFRAGADGLDLEGTLTAGGTVTVDGGDLVVLDNGGAEIFRANASGLTLEGLLRLLSGSDIRVEDGGTITVEDSGGGDRIVLDGSTGELRVLAGGDIRWDDDLDNNRIEIAEHSFPAGDGVALIYRDESGNTIATLGEHEIDGQMVDGLIVQGATGDQFDLIRASETDGSLLADGRDFTAGDSGSLVLRVDQDQELDLLDSAGNLRATIGPLASGDYGLLIQRSNGDDVAKVADGAIYLNKPDGSTTILRINDTDGLRLNVDTDSDGMQSGKVTAGPTDSAGTGFRTLRIPN